MFGIRREGEKFVGPHCFRSFDYEGGCAWVAHLVADVAATGYLLWLLVLARWNRNRGLEERVSREGSFDSIFTRVTVSALCCVEREKIYIYV